MQVSTGYAAEKKRWGKHLPAGGFGFLGKGSPEVSEGALDGTTAGSPCTQALVTWYT